MTLEERAEFIRSKFEEIMVTLESKGRDYGGEIANSNFDRGSEACGISKYAVWYVYFSKHLDSLGTWIRNGQVESEPIEGRLTDLINYLFILWSMIEESGEDA